jgi:hypothetical protein
MVLKKPTKNKKMGLDNSWLGSNLGYLDLLHQMVIFIVNLIPKKLPLS